MKILYLLVILSLSILVVSDPTPPIYADSFEVRIDETFVLSNGTKYRVNSYLFYDAAHDRERMDRFDGSHDLFCSSVLPNVTTSCRQITTGGKRYIYYPARKQCCFCCDSAHGCGILKKDWMKDGTYMGSETIGDFEYDKWNKQGNTYNYLWVSKDENKMIRRLDEGGSHITDYLTNTYINKTIPDSVFQLPVDCTANCPLSSICGKLRGDQELSLTKEQ